MLCTPPPPSTQHPPFPSLTPYSLLSPSPPLPLLSLPSPSSHSPPLPLTPLSLLSLPSPPLPCPQREHEGKAAQLRRLHQDGQGQGAGPLRQGLVLHTGSVGRPAHLPPAGSGGGGAHQGLWRWVGVRALACAVGKVEMSFNCFAVNDVVLLALIYLACAHEPGWGCVQAF